MPLRTASDPVIGMNSIRTAIGVAMMAVMVFGVIAPASARTTNPRTHSVKSYTTKRGTLVHAHVQTDPNKTQRDNFSAKGNRNPVTGKQGAKRVRK